MSKTDKKTEKDIENLNRLLLKLLHKIDDDNTDLESDYYIGEPSCDQYDDFDYISKSGTFYISARTQKEAEFLFYITTSIFNYSDIGENLDYFLDIEDISNIKNIDDLTEKDLDNYINTKYTSNWTHFKKIPRDEHPRMHIFIRIITIDDYIKHLTDLLNN